MSKSNYKVGRKVVIVSDNENYDDFRDEVLIITHSECGGNGYDMSVYPTHFTGLYKGYEIIKRIDSHTCIIYKDNDIVKCIAGDIYQDGTTNAIDKAKQYINQLIK